MSQGRFSRAPGHNCTWCLRSMRGRSVLLGRQPCKKVELLLPPLTWPYLDSSMPT
jgi:hypothetical protein